jgi:hypothetical protein
VPEVWLNSMIIVTKTLTAKKSENHLQRFSKHKINIKFLRADFNA